MSWVGTKPDVAIYIAFATQSTQTIHNQCCFIPKLYPASECRGEPGSEATSVHTCTLCYEKNCK